MMHGLAPLTRCVWETQRVGSGARQRPREVSLPPNIHFLVIGHPDYPGNAGLEMARRAAAWLGEHGVQRLSATVILRPWDAVAAAEEALAARPDGVIVFLATWVEAPTAIAAIREFKHLPVAVWGFPMYGPGRAESTGSFVAYAVVKAALDRMGIAYTGLAGAVDDEDTLARALAFCRAARAKQALRRARVGLVGYASMGMYSGTFDHALLRAQVGPEVDHVDTYTLIRRAKGYGEADCAEVVTRLRGRARVAAAVGEAALVKQARLYLALRDLARRRTGTHSPSSASMSYRRSTA